MRFFVYSSVFYSLFYRLRREILQIKFKFYEIFLFIALCFIVFYIAYGEKFYKLKSNFTRVLFCQLPLLFHCVRTIQNIDYQLQN